MKNNYPIKLIRFVFLGLLCFIFNNLQAEKQTPIASQGQIDLRNWNFEEQGVIDLRGEWKFYWRQLIYEADFPEPNRGDVTGYIELPSIWNDKKVNDKKLGAEGYAVFRLNVLLNRKEIPKAGLRLKTFGSACNIYVNGKKIYEAGKVGRHAHQSQAGYAPAIADFVPDSDQLDIVVQVSNFDHRVGGAWYPIQFGTEKKVRQEREKTLIFNVLILGCIVIMGIYHLGLYYLHRRISGAIYFSVICLIMAIRIMATGEYLIYYLFDNWSIILKLEFLSFYLAFPITAHFINSLFPKEFSPNILRVITGISVFFAVLVLVFPPSIFTHTVGIYRVIAILISVYLLIVVITAMRENRKGARTFIVGMAILFITILNDILFSAQWIETGYFSPLGVLFFIASQSLTLASQFTRALHQAEELTSKLNYTNQHLEEIVRERTQSIEKTNEKLGLNQQKLEAKNRELLFQQEEITVQSVEIQKAGKEILIKNNKLEKQKSKLKSALDELKMTQTRLIHSEKMVSLGQLTAGMAHEINNPINFVNGGVNALQGLFEDLIEISDKYTAIDNAQTPEELEKVRKEVKKLKLLLNYDELKSDITQVLGSVKNGAERTKKIVEGLRTFSRLDEANLKMIDLHENIDITLNLLRGEYQTRIRIVKNYDVRITQMECYPAQLNQVFMNLLLNAVQSIKNIGTITITTEFENDNFINIRFKDTGEGISKSIQSKIFDPFFTKGKVGTTGLGLAISHSIIEQHHGEIYFESEDEKGTEFTIRLPITQFNNQDEFTVARRF